MLLYPTTGKTLLHVAFNNKTAVAYPGGAVLESYRVSNIVPQRHIHLLRDTLGHGHGRDTTGLGTSNHTIGCVAVFMEVLQAIT